MKRTTLLLECEVGETPLFKVDKVFPLEGVESGEGLASADSGLEAVSLTSFTLFSSCLTLFSELFNP